MHYFCQNLPIFKGSFASSIKKSSIERARACSKMKIRALSMLEHQKLTSDGHFSGSSMLGCNTSHHFPPNNCHTDALSIAILNISFSRKVRKERKLQFLQTLLWSAYCTFTLSPMLCLLFRAFVTFWMVKWKIKEYFQKSICQNKCWKFQSLAKIVAKQFQNKFYL